MGIARDMKGITEDIVASYDARVKEMGKLVADTHETLKGFHRDHKEMAGHLRASLEKSAKDIQKYVADKTKEFHNAHADMSEELKENLAKCKENLAKYVTSVASETRKLLRSFKDERQDRAVSCQNMAASWQNMAATMNKRRGARPFVSVGGEVGTVEKATTVKAKKRGRKSKK